VLRPTGRNVRKTPRMSIPELAASIQRVGLLQNLIVIPAADGEHYEVVAGGRRLAALKLLAKKHRIAKDWECLAWPMARPAPPASPRTCSAKPCTRPTSSRPSPRWWPKADPSRTLRRISVTPLVVQRRLKLANVSPRLMADYRADAVSLDQLMALPSPTTTPRRKPRSTMRNGSATPHLRERLTEREIDAYRHPLVRFVGLDAYEQAGGGIRRDLFAEGDAGVYLTDAALLERLAQDKLAGIAAEVKAEGWAWVDATPGVTHADLHAFQRAPRTPRAEQARSAAHRSCKPRCRRWPKPWMPRWTPRTRTRPTPCRRKAKPWASSCRRWKMACRTTPRT
jgi:ParB family chromosome partitioning protein